MHAVEKNCGMDMKKEKEGDDGTGIVAGTEKKEIGYYDGKKQGFVNPPSVGEGWDLDRQKDLKGKKLARPVLKKSE